MLSRSTRKSDPGSSSMDRVVFRFFTLDLYLLTVCLFICSHDELHCFLICLMISTVKGITSTSVVAEKGLLAHQSCNIYVALNADLINQKLRQHDPTKPYIIWLYMPIFCKRGKFTFLLISHLFSKTKRFNSEPNQRNEILGCFRCMRLDQ